MTANVIYHRFLDILRQLDQNLWTSVVLLLAQPRIVEVIEKKRDESQVLISVLDFLYERIPFYGPRALPPLFQLFEAVIEHNPQETGLTDRNYHLLLSLLSDSKFSFLFPDALSCLKVLSRSSEFVSCL